jgi:predicted AlkP superfamily pyrophosphatase or phosphodiesterase
LRAIILMGCALLVWGCQTKTLKERHVRDAAEMGRLAPISAGTPRRVVLITISGLQSSDFLDPWGHVAGPGQAVRMPNLAELAREGVIGLSAFPPSPGASRTSHATLVTGLSPRRHGIVSDVTLDESGSRSLPFLDSRMLQGVPLWDAAIARGVLALDWPTTSVARIELLVPEVRVDEGVSWLDQIRSQSTQVLVRGLEAQAAADLERSASDLTGFEKREPSSWPNPSEKDAALIEVACEVAASERDPGLWLLRLSQTEVTQRASGGGSLETSAALAAVDQGLGRFIDCLREAGRLEDTALFVVGDVAYQPVHSTVEPNIALVRSGLIGRDPRSTTGVRSWLALARSQGRSAYVYARETSSALEARDVLKAEAARTGAFTIVSAKDLEAAEADPQAWFGLVATPGYQIGNALDGEAVRVSDARSMPGAFRLGESSGEAVGFVAWGKGVRSQVRVLSLYFEDIAPTIAGLLGLRLDDDLDGREISGIMRGAVAPPPPGPKRLGVEGKGKASDYLRR